MGNCFSSQKQELDKDKVEHVEDSIPINPPQQQTPPGKMALFKKKTFHRYTHPHMFTVRMSNVNVLTRNPNRI